MQSRSDVYEHSTLHEMLPKQNISDKTIAFFTDVDFTLIYDESTNQDKMGDSIKHYDNYSQYTHEVSRILAAFHIPLIPISGIDLPILKEYQSKNILPKSIPVAALSVGAEIWVMQDTGLYQLDNGYREYIEKDVGFDRTEIYRICLEFKELIDTQIECGNLPELYLEFQERDKNVNNLRSKGKNDRTYQGEKGEITPQPYKISFKFSGTNQIAQELARVFQHLLIRRGFTKIKTLFSQDTRIDDNTAIFNIDVIPVTKDEAIRYICDKFNLISIYAGDSGNDIAAIEGAAQFALIVGNARQDLLNFIHSKEYVGGIRLRKYDIGGHVIRVHIDTNKNDRGPVSILKFLHLLYNINHRYQNMNRIRNHSQE